MNYKVHTYTIYVYTFDKSITGNPETLAVPIYTPG